eukprot:m.235280 g.235280  ORF g.235280 m.235280 type:complete len:52 (+) comp18923_c0_seq17:2157-2312(+)
MSPSTRVGDGETVAESHTTGYVPMARRLVVAPVCVLAAPAMPQHAATAGLQ